MAEPAWVWTDDPDDPCPYCVQWRPEGSEDYNDPRRQFDPHEPYWPDGSVAPKVCRSTCKPCEDSIAAYIEATS